MNKARSGQVPLAQPVPDPCAACRLLQLMAVGASAREGPPGPQQVPVGAVPAVLLPFLKGGSFPMPTGSPGGGCASLGRCRGRPERGAPLWGAGLPFSPPSLLDSQNSDWVSGVWRQPWGCRGLSWQESGNQNICAQAWAPQPLMVLTELLWSVVWKICILRRARGGRGTADRGGT